MSVTGFEVDIDYSQAACADVDNPEIFFPDGGSDHRDKVAEAKAICGTCPVIEQCFQHGVYFEKQGIWGGHTPPELAAYRTANGIELKDLSKDFSPENDLRSAGGELVIWARLADME
jgi:WhiB family redox-sensing transcriptional regulator